MVITKELLKKLEMEIGNDCTVCVVPDETGTGLLLRAMIKSIDTGDRHYHQRLFSFGEMRGDT